MYLVMLETNGNQRFVFESPRLRDAIGASYLVARLDHWTEEEFNKMSPAQPQDYEAACVSRSSGKVIVRVNDDEAAKSLISAVTRRAAAQAPGLDVTGVFIKTAGDAVCGADVQGVHEVAARYAMSRPPVQARFAQMPFLVRGQDSALPASPRLAAFLPGEKLDDEANDDRTAALSLPSRVKRYYALHGREEFLAKMAEGASDSGVKYENLRRDTNKLEESIRQALEGEIEQIEHAFEGSAPWNGLSEDSSFASQKLSRVAIIHIDGNGIGATMKSLYQKFMLLTGNEEKLYLLDDPRMPECDKSFPAFVKTINRAFEDAVTTACQKAYWLVAKLQFPQKVENGLTEGDIVHVVPVLLGGDDATVIANGKYALPFTVEFLRAFEELTANDPLLCAVNNEERFTAGAGVAIVPTKFPFHLAYDLSEYLASQAKTVGKKRNLSTFCYHQLVDTTILDTAALIDRYAEQSTQPFIVSDKETTGTSPGDNDPSSDDGEYWEDMVAKTAVFAGLYPAQGQREAVAFPGARAQRMRRYQALIVSGLDDYEHGLVIPETEERQKPSQLLEKEWEAAKVTSPELAALCDAIGDQRFFFDLINFKELLPQEYVRSELGISNEPDAAAAERGE